MESWVATCLQGQACVGQSLFYPYEFVVGVELKSLKLDSQTFLFLKIYLATSNEDSSCVT